ncbi:MarR family winged helix-turn-helix transcriptional regulator [Leifsonia sp. NPDC056824]|uniref:MarR family winged helix-turn-helix transcriptional regulator n=1 Tax=Leifsonia sp. NPDC056824 TaxID=3345953 RepID=UPI0036D18653
MLPLTSMTGFLLQKSGAILLAHAERALEARGTRVRHFYVLAALNDTPDLSQHDLSQMIGIDAGILGSLIDEMETDGHVERRRNPLDKRRYVVNITKLGRDVLVVLLDDMQKIEQEFLSSLSDSEAGNLRKYLERALAGRWPEVIECGSPGEI